MQGRVSLIYFLILCGEIVRAKLLKLQSNSQVTSTLSQFCSAAFECQDETVVQNFLMSNDQVLNLF